MLFEVIVTNGLLGNSVRIMTMQEIEKFNICALLCAKNVKKFGGEHSSGMWTVKQAAEQAIQRHEQTTNFADEIIKQDVQLLDDQKPCR